MNLWPKTCRSMLRPLKRACVLNPEMLPESTDPDFKFEYIDIGNVTLEAGIAARERVTFANAPSRARKPVRAGDVIVSTVRTYLKAVASIGPDPRRWIVSTGFAVLRPNAQVDPRFLYRVVQANPFVDGVVAASTGVSYPAITPSALGNIPVPLPDRPTQKAIADFLDRETARIDQLIEKKKHLIVLADERKMSLIEFAITNGSEETRLGHHVEILPGYAFPSSEFSSSPDQIPLLRGVNVVPGRICWDEVMYWPCKRMAEVNRFLLQEGDVVLGMDRPWVSKGIRVAELSARDAPSLLLQRVCKVSPRRTLDKGFMKLLLVSRKFLGYFEPILTGVSVPHISADQIRAFRFNYVTRDRQEELARDVGKKVASIDQMNDLVESSIDRLREFRSALITAAVTGQINVTTWTHRGETDRRMAVIEQDMAS